MNRQVAYYEVYALLAPWLGDPGLIVGTPDWCGLDDTDPRKWRAVPGSAVWWALAEDARQAAMAEASRAISASHGRYLSEHFRLMHARGGPAYIPRKAS